jgi:hypothetical protein
MERSGRAWALVGRVGAVVLVVAVQWPLPGRFADAPAGVPTSGWGEGTGRAVPPGEIVAGLLGGDRPAIWNEPQYRWAGRTPPGTRVMVTRRSPYFMGPLYGPTAANAVVLVTEPIRPDALATVMRRRDLHYAYLWAYDPLAYYARTHPAQFVRVGHGGGSLTVRLVDRSERRPDGTR